MALDQNHLQMLETLIASGELSCMFEGRKIEYRSQKELLEAYEFVRARVAPDDRRDNRTLAVLDRDGT